MALFKKEIFVNANSVKNFDQAMDFSLAWLQDNFQNVPSNKDSQGVNIDYFFADVFFDEGHSTNSRQVWRIYTLDCTEAYPLSPKPSGRIETEISDIDGTDSKIAYLQRQIDELSKLSPNIQAEVL